MSKELTSEYLLLKLSLYSPLKLKDEHLEFLDKFLSEYEPDQIDCYCVECKKESTFKKVTMQKQVINGLTPFSPPLKTIEEKIISRINRQ